MTSRRHIYARQAAPKPKLGGIPDLTWAGSATWTADGIVARLLDCHGWALEFSATEHGADHLVLKGTIKRLGEELPPWDDSGLRIGLMTAATGMVERVIGGPLSLRDGTWTGFIGGIDEGLFIKLTAEPSDDDRLVLRGLG